MHIFGFEAPREMNDIRSFDLAFPLLSTIRQQLFFHAKPHRAGRPCYATSAKDTATTNPAAGALDCEDILGIEGFTRRLHLTCPLTQLNMASQCIVGSTRVL